jgi:hypothetical protein
METVKIIYNNQDAFAPFPTPFVGLDQNNIRYGELWGAEDTLTLDGVITGCRFEDIYSGQQKLLNNWNKSYQNLEIWQYQGVGSGLIYKSDFVEIDSISFPSDRYVGILPYTINLRCYPSGYFSGEYGILDPNDEWNFGEQDNVVASITHSVGCRAFNTSNSDNNSLERAKVWTLNKRGLNSIVSPTFIENFSTGNMCLISTVENIDRFNGTYSIVDTYSSDLARTGYGILRYTTDFQSGDNLISVSLNGSVQGCGQSITGVRQVFARLDKYKTAAISYEKIFAKNDLNPIPLTINVSEDPSNSTLNFSYTFDNDNSPESVFDYDVNVTSGSFIAASINGTVSSRGGDIRTKLNKSKAYASGIAPFELTASVYNDFFANYAAVPLNSRARASGVSVNEFNGTVSINASFDNKPTPNCLNSFEYTLNFIPSLRKFDAKGVINGNGIYSVVDLGWSNRATLSINGNAIISDNCTAESGLAIVKNEINSLISQYTSNNNIILETNQISFNKNNNKVIDINASWSFDTVGQVVDGQTYDKIHTFRVEN